MDAHPYVVKVHLSYILSPTAAVTNIFFQNFTHLDDHTRQTTDTPGFKRFTILFYSEIGYRCCPFLSEIGFVLPIAAFLKYRGIPVMSNH